MSTTLSLLSLVTYLMLFPIKVALLVAGQFMRLRYMAKYVKNTTYSGDVLTVNINDFKPYFTVFAGPCLKSVWERRF